MALKLSEPVTLLTRYDNLRRKQREALIAMVDTLGKVDGLSDDQLAQGRDALFHADHPYLVTMVGAFNSGKSSLINALLGTSVLPIGATPTTQRIAIIRYGETTQTISGGEAETILHPSPLLQRVSFVDTPGLESIYKEHDETTRKFLHRADLVMLIMLATQAMSASSIQQIQSLRAYGKRLIICINQIDLLEPDEREAVRKFVAEQGKLSLGETPTVWLLSAKWAMAAQQSSPRDEMLWNESGFAQIEAYYNHALSDAERVRQKLETPLQIMRNVISVANAQVAKQQDTLAEYRRSAANVRGQIDTAIREQEAAVRAIEHEISGYFNEAARRGQLAIKDVFQWSKALALIGGGIGEITGLAKIFRRMGAQTPAKNAFEAHKVDEPLAQIPAAVDRLAPRLEGRDVKDTDDLILYTKAEIERLPGALQAKVIGKLEPPQSYDRSIAKNAREPLNQILEQARTSEFKRIDEAVRNTIATLSVYILLTLLLGLFFSVILGATGGGGSIFLLILLMLALVIGGLSAVPVRGNLMARAHAKRIEAIRSATYNSWARLPWIRWRLGGRCALMRLRHSCGWWNHNWRRPMR